MEHFIYRGSKTKEISFPLGGIGAGCIGLSGNGRFIDWEIFNKPNKGSLNGFSHFAVKVESEGKVLDARALNGDLQPPYSGDYNRAKFQSFGFGPHRSTMAGIPHFKEVEFEGKYPFANLKFIDSKFPGKVEMTAFNPLIPLNDKDSSIPGAFFEIEAENTLNTEATYTFALSLSNPLSQGFTVNSYKFADSIHMLKFYSSKLKEEDLEYGDLCIATDAEEISYQENWYRGAWFDNLGIYWKNFTTDGKFHNRSYPIQEDGKEQYPGGSDTSTMAAHITLAPGEKRKVRFVVTWSFPNVTNYWNPEKCDSAGCGCNTSKQKKSWKNYYVSLFENSEKSAIYSLKNWKRLYNDTKSFSNALFSSTMPVEAIDAVSANISILKTPTCLRLEDGSFYGFEGCHCNEGCCDGSCTHVWNYAYALPFLFPKLERSMRDLDFKYNQRDDGGMGFRLQLPVGREKSGFRPCADGQFGGVIKAYRDWKIFGNDEWLKSNWNAIKKSIDFAWADTNEDKWDADKEGVLEGRQHHTLDMELFGPNSWLTGFYLAALKAGAEIADYFGENEKSNEYLQLFKRGKKWVDENLFNGQYYHQLVDLNDKSILQNYNSGNAITGSDAVDAYWNQEAGEMKYQIGEGCAIDQVVAQWHANLCGLGEIFSKENVKSALKSIYNNNYKKSMRGFFNPCRLYTINDEGGVIICDWPEGKYKPVVPLTYAEETMYGFEYQVAIHMIQEGLIDEGMEIVKEIRSRFDGEKRNPWNEFECGSNYARSMASYALLNTFSGFEYDMVKGSMGFNPIYKENGISRSFWSLDSGWGTFEMTADKIEIKVIYGELNLSKYKLPFLEKMHVEEVLLCNKVISCKVSDGYISFESCIHIPKGESVKISLKKQ